MLSTPSRFPLVLVSDPKPLSAAVITRRPSETFQETAAKPSSMAVVDTRRPQELLRDATEKKDVTSGNRSECLDLFPETSVRRRGPTKYYVPGQKDLIEPRLTVVIPFPVGNRVLCCVEIRESNGPTSIRHFLAEHRAGKYQFIATLDSLDLTTTLGYLWASKGSFYRFPETVPVTLGAHGMVTNQVISPAGEFETLRLVYTGLKGTFTKAGLDAVHWGPVTKRIWLEYGATSPDLNERERNFLPLRFTKAEVAVIDRGLQDPIQFALDNGFERARQYHTVWFDSKTDWASALTPSGRISLAVPHPAGGTVGPTKINWRSPSGDWAGRAREIIHDEKSPYVWLTTVPVAAFDDGVQRESWVRFPLDKKAPSGWFDPGEAELMRAYDRSTEAPGNWRAIKATSPRFLGGQTSLTPAFPAPNGKTLGAKFPIGLPKNVGQLIVTGVLCLAPDDSYVVRAVYRSKRVSGGEQDGAVPSPNAFKLGSIVESSCREMGRDVRRYILFQKTGTDLVPTGWMSHSQFILWSALRSAEACGRFEPSTPLRISGICNQNGKLAALPNLDGRLIQSEVVLQFGEEIDDLYFTDLRSCGGGRFLISGYATVESGEVDRQVPFRAVIDGKGIGELKHNPREVRISRMVGILYDRALLSVAEGWNPGTTRETCAFTQEFFRPNFERGMQLAYGAWRFDRNALFSALSGQRYLMTRDITDQSEILVICQEGSLAHAAAAVRRLALGFSNLRIVFLSPSEWASRQGLGEEPTRKFLEGIHHIDLLAARGDVDAIEKEYARTSPDAFLAGGISGGPALKRPDLWQPHVRSYCVPDMYGALVSQIQLLVLADNKLWPLKTHLRVISYCSFLLDALAEVTPQHPHNLDIRERIFGFVPALRDYPGAWQIIQEAIAGDDVGTESTADNDIHPKPAIPQPIKLKPFNFVKWITSRLKSKPEARTFSDSPASGSDATVTGNTVYSEGFRGVIQVVKGNGNLTTITQALERTDRFAREEAHALDSAVATLVYQALLLDATHGSEIRRRISDSPPVQNLVELNTLLLAMRTFGIAAQYQFEIRNAGVTRQEILALTRRCRNALLTKST